jgi:hypothetical protein
MREEPSYFSLFSHFGTFGLFWRIYLFIQGNHMIYAVTHHGLIVVFFASMANLLRGTSFCERNVQRRTDGNHQVFLVLLINKFWDCVVYSVTHHFLLVKFLSSNADLLGGTSLGG